MFSMAVTWPALSPSNLPAAVSSWRRSPAAFFAPSFIFTKNGLVSVLVIRPIVTGPLPPEEPAVPDPPVLLAPLPQAAVRAPMARPAASTAPCRRPRDGWVEVMSTPSR